jgi:hypothetical protein
MIDNVIQAIDDTFYGNYWDNDYPDGGNYWSDFDEPSEGAYDDYNGVSQNKMGSDGIVDRGTIGGPGKNPYVIDSDSFDNYPLTDAIEPPEIPLPPPEEPTLYINTSPDGKDVVLYWVPPSTPGISHYLIYRSTSQTGFDFNSPWVNTSFHSDNGVIPMRTSWNDTDAACPDKSSNYEEQYYYVIRAVNTFGKVSNTSRTVGKWTKIFSKGVSTFSLPLEPLENTTIDNCLNDMNAIYIKWMNRTTHTWIKHWDGSVNDTQMKVGEGYEVKFDTQTNYTFTGMPGAMISYNDDSGFLGFNPATEARNLRISVETNGDFTLTWEEPSSMNAGDWYEVYYSNTRDGFFGTLGIHYYLACPEIYFDTNSTTIPCFGANNSGLYFMIVPFNATGIRGSSTYSIGIWNATFSGYGSLGLPLKIDSVESLDWYCDEIPNTWGMNYYIYDEQRWCWHKTSMQSGIYDVPMEPAVGYQISTTADTSYIFIGR